MPRWSVLSSATAASNRPSSSDPLRRIAVTVAALVALALAAPLATAEVVQEGGLRVSFGAGVSPHGLPRGKAAPISVELSGAISTADGSEPPQLSTISVAINRTAKLDYAGLPTCNYHQIQPASTAEAIESCSDSVVGRGDFKAAVALPEQSPFPSQGQIVAFNGLLHGQHVIFAHIYGTTPLPQSSVIVFRIGRASGNYRLQLTAQLPLVAAEWGHVSGVRLTLGREFTYRGRQKSFLSASCPAPKGFTVATAPFARVGFGFADGRLLQSTLVRSCAVK
jgi:hypothetical protein